MKKLVNGRIVNINNIELFEKAFEGAALRRAAVSLVGETVPDSPLLNECIKYYEDTYKSLPFPLYAIEDNIKYAVIGMNIKDRMEHPLRMWADGGLYVKIADNKALKFVGNTWGVVTITRELPDNTEISLYEGEIGYKEFLWAVKKLMRGESLRDFYQVFMKEFYEACNGEPMLLKWELAHILDFGYVPKQLNFKDNRIIDLNTGCEYFLDIFSAGKREVSENIIVIRVGGDKPGYDIKKKTANVYDFEVYEKQAGSEDIFSEKNTSKLRKVRIEGAGAVFQAIVKASTDYGDVNNVIYKGFIVDDLIIFEVADVVYISTAGRYNKPQEIGRGLNLYSYENGQLYMVKMTLCNEEQNVYKEVIYSYNVVNGIVRLCRIGFK